MVVIISIVCLDFWISKYVNVFDILLIFLPWLKKKTHKCTLLCVFFLFMLRQLFRFFSASECKWVQSRDEPLSPVSGLQDRDGAVGGWCTGDTSDCVRGTATARKGGKWDGWKEKCPYFSLVMPCTTEFRCQSPVRTLVVGSKKSNAEHEVCLW